MSRANLTPDRTRRTLLTATAAFLLAGSTTAVLPHGQATAQDSAPSLPTDLRSRKDGDDWPKFLGPTGDSKSREKGIRTDWKANPPKKLWSKRVGIS